MPRRPLALLLALPLLATACPEGEVDDPRIVDHVLSRAAFGPEATTRARVGEIGLRGWIEEQLHPEAIADPEADALLASLPTQALSLSALYERRDVTGAASALSEAKQAKLLRAVYSRRQLEQVLTDFWFDHFNVDAGVSIPRWSLPHYEREAIRRHVLGRFEDLLLATARHPAMLLYLDNVHNRQDWTEPDGTFKPGINENYARELLELHTVGSDGGYEQADVREVARALTGWSVDWTYAGDGFSFETWAHDWNAKRVMGLEIPAGGGEVDGVTVLRFLATHPMTAERLSRLLVQRFVDETPPPRLVVAATARWLETGGDLREVMRTILTSPEFLSLEHARTKVKRPFVFVTSLLRATGPGLDAVRSRGVAAVDALGEKLYEAKPPTGIPDESAAWGGPGALLDRLNLADEWARNASARGIDWGVTDGSPELLVNLLAWRLLAGRIGEPSLAAGIGLVASLPAALAPPRRVDQTAGFVLASPEFLLH